MAKADEQKKKKKKEKEKENKNKKKKRGCISKIHYWLHKSSDGDYIPENIAKEKN